MLRPLLALLLALRLAAALSHAHTLFVPFTASPFYSAGATAPVPAGNLYERENLERALAARAFRGELILTAFNCQPAAVEWAAHYTRMLRARGFEHLLLLGDNRTACELLAAAEPGAPCGWLALPQEARWHGAHVRPEFLWLKRFWLAGEALARGTGVLLTDTDVLLHRDPYPQLKRGAFRNASLLVMPNEVNGGLWYANAGAAAPDGPTVWLLREVVRRGALLADMDAALPAHEPEWGSQRHGCSLMDQSLFQDLLLVLGRADSDAADWPCLRPGQVANATWAAAGVPEAELPRPGGVPDVSDAMNRLWRRAPCDTASPTRDAVCAESAETCARLIHYETHIDGAHTLQGSAIGFDLRLPARVAGSRQPERLSRAPMHLFDGQMSATCGWNDARHRPWGAVTHFVGGGPNFGQQRGGKGSRRHQLQAQRAWFGPPPARPRRGVLLAAPALVRAAAANASEAPFLELVARVARWAAIADRVPVIPAVPCDAAWMPRSNFSRTGVYCSYDSRYLAVQPPHAGAPLSCYPMASIGECSEAHAWGQFLLEDAPAELRADAATLPVATRAAVQSATAFALQVEALPDVAMDGSLGDGDALQRYARFRVACRQYAEPAA